MRRPTVFELRKSIPPLLAAVLLVTGCQATRSRSERSFDEIKRLVEGKTAGQIVGLLGAPDTRQKAFDADERWIWWNFTFLAGNDHPPEVRGRVVHLEILFRNPAALHETPPPQEQWPVDGAFGISYRLPERDG